MSALVIEMWDGNGWKRLGAAAEDQPGSMSNRASGNREMLFFSCEGEHSLIERSIGGVDQELAARTLRLAHSIGFELIAKLGPGQVHEQLVQTDRMGEPVRIRFRHEEEGT